jgi:hypothetical protein
VRGESEWWNDYRVNTKLDNKFENWETIAEILFIWFENNKHINIEQFKITFVLCILDCGMLYIASLQYYTGYICNM